MTWLSRRIARRRMVQCEGSWIQLGSRLRVDAKAEGYVVCLVIPAQTYLDTVGLKVSLESRYVLRNIFTNCCLFS